jgi:hypothetical protein
MSDYYAERYAVGVPMTRPDRYLWRMAAFLAMVLGVIGLLLPRLIPIFLANPVLNSLIAVVFLIGVGHLFRQVAQLRAEVAWIEVFRRREPGLVQPPSPVLLAPMAALLRERQGRVKLSAASFRSILDSVAARLEESRDTARYEVGLLVFLGLLGTFWGLLDTVAAVANALKSLDVGGGDLVQLWERLRQNLEAPLTGMGIAFASSLLGLGGSLVLGFLDLQAGQAQNRFYNELEDWLAGVTRVSAGAAGDGDQNLPAYVSALLEQTADSLDNLQRTLIRTTEDRGQASIAMQEAAAKVALLAERLGDQRAAATANDEAMRALLRSIDNRLALLTDETTSGQRRLADDLRQEIKLLAKTVGAGLDRQG